MPINSKNQIYPIDVELRNKLFALMSEKMKKTIGEENGSTFSMVNTLQEIATKVSKIISTKKLPEEIFRSLIEEGCIVTPSQSIKIKPAYIEKKEEDNNKIFQYAYKIDPYTFGQENFTTEANEKYIDKELSIVNAKNKIIKLNLNRTRNQNQETLHTISIEYKDQEQGQEQLAEEIANIIAAFETIKKYKKIKPNQYNAIISNPNNQRPIIQNTTEESLDKTSQSQEITNKRKKFLKFTTFGVALAMLISAAVAAILLTPIGAALPIVAGIISAAVALTGFVFGASEQKNNKTISPSHQNKSINEAAKSNAKSIYDSMANETTTRATNTMNTEHLEDTIENITENKINSVNHYATNSSIKKAEEQSIKSILKKRNSLDSKDLYQSTNSSQQEKDITNNTIAKKQKKTAFNISIDPSSSESTEKKLPSETSLTYSESEKLSDDSKRRSN